MVSLKRFLKSWLSLYIILKPFYIFNSGLPQIADFLVFIVFITRLLKRESLTLSHLSFFGAFVAYTTIVNSMNQLMSAGSYTSLAPAYGLFNLIFLILVFTDIKNATLTPKKILRAIIISVALQLLLFFLGVGRTWSDSNGIMARGIMFFNNPNQLGYFTILIATLVVIIYKFKGATTISIVIFVLFGCIFLAIFSLSRSALFALGLLLLIVVLTELGSSRLRFLVPILLLLIYAKENIYLSNKITALSNRVENSQGSTLSEELAIRGYDRLLYYPEYLFFGAGEGGNNRWSKARTDKEIHSLYGTLLFSYGITGSVLFMFSLIQISRGLKVNRFIYFLPLLVYNLSHNGMRNALFFLVFVLSVYESRDKSVKSFHG